MCLHKKNGVLLVFLVSLYTINSGCSGKALVPDTPKDEPNIKTVDLVNDLRAVHEVDSESAAKLDSLYSYAPEERREVLKNVLRRIMENYFKDKGIELGTMKDRIFKYLKLPQSETNRIYFYLASGENLEAKDVDGKIHTGYIKNGCIISVVSKSDSSVYILKCANGLITQTNLEFAKKQLIGELQNKIQTKIIYFGLNKSEIQSLSEKEKEKLKTCAELISIDHSVRVDIIGHTDSQGQVDDNYRLSLKRAISVQNHLIRLGVSRIQIADYQGRGESELIQKDDENGEMKEQFAKRNRRVEVKMYTWDIVTKPTLSQKF